MCVVLKIIEQHPSSSILNLFNSQPNPPVLLFVCVAKANSFSTDNGQLENTQRNQQQSILKTISTDNRQCSYCLLLVHNHNRLVTVGQNPIVVMSTHTPNSAQEAAHLAARVAAGYTPPPKLQNPHMPSQSRHVVPPVQPMSMSANLISMHATVPGGQNFSPPSMQTPISRHSGSPSSSQGQGNGASGTVSVSASAPTSAPVSVESSSSMSVSVAKGVKEQYLWEMNVEEIRDWLYETQPLFPQNNIGTYRCASKLQRMHMTIMMNMRYGTSD